MNATPNICAGPFGAFYDFYIERPALMRLIGRTVWGIDATILYASMEKIAALSEGAAILDVPCGGGVAFRAQRPGRHARYVAVDISQAMISRAMRRADESSLQIEFLLADMTDLPFADDEFDLVLCYSGLHMVHDAERAVAEIARCLKPGGRLLGTTFLAEGPRRARALFGLGTMRGHPLPPRREDLLTWMSAADLVTPAISGRGFAEFSARKRAGSIQPSGPRPPARSPSATSGQ